MKTQKTICANCKHCEVLPSKTREKYWYDYTCKAVIRQLETDLITGIEIYTEPDGPTSNKHPYCRSINKGDCEHFKAKE